MKIYNKNGNLLIEVSGVDLHSANLRNADLSGADLHCANLRNADLSFANLQGADLSYADLSYADLRDADLSYAYLRDADLYKVDLRNANLHGTCLDSENAIPAKENTMEKEVKSWLEDHNVVYSADHSLPELIDLLRNAPNINWNWLSMCGDLSDDFIREFQGKLDWGILSECQELSESLIREFQHKVNWVYISACQELSEAFISEFQDKVNWLNIFSHQKLSDEFRQEFESKFYEWGSSDSDIREPKTEDLEKEIIRLNIRLGAVETERDHFKDRLTDYEDSFTSVMAETCEENDKGNVVHCTCVPYLRKRICELTEERDHLKDKLTEYLRTISMEIMG